MALLTTTCPYYAYECLLPEIRQKISFSVWGLIHCACYLREAAAGTSGRSQ